MSYFIRWCVDKDLKAISDLDYLTYGLDSYDLKELSNIRSKSKNTNILVCDDYVNGIIGYMIYQLTDPKVYLLRLTVDPEFHDTGIGSAFLDKLTERLKKDRNIIEIELEDYNLVGHLFLKKHGFKATEVLWGNGMESDLYVFQKEKET